MKDAEKTLKALANRRRLAILKLLSKTTKAAVGEIAKEIKLSFKSTSKHLGILHNAYILDREQVNLQVYYSLGRPASSNESPRSRAARYHLQQLCHSEECIRRGIP